MRGNDGYENMNEKDDEINNKVVHIPSSSSYKSVIVEG